MSRANTRGGAVAQDIVIQDSSYGRANAESDLGKAY